MYKNDIQETNNVLGIEAARQCIYNELDESFESYINYHHLSLLCDRMTATKKMVSVFRHGINNDNIGPIAKASFEETSEMFAKAAKHGELDELTGISSNIMCGQMGNYGTSAFNVYLNMNEYYHQDDDNDDVSSDEDENDDDRLMKIQSEINNEKNSDIDEIKKSKMKNDNTVEDNLVALIAKIGEKITIGKTKTISNSSSTNYQYLHTVVKDNLAKLAVVVSLETKDQSETVKNFGKQLSMHIAASNPIALDSSLIDKEILDKEQKLITEELKNSGKPEDIAKKISLGKMNKFKEENALLTQAWVMEPKKKVQDVLKELSIADLKIKEFYRIKIGE